MLNPSRGEVGLFALVMLGWLGALIVGQSGISEFSPAGRWLWFFAILAGMASTILLTFSCWATWAAIDRIHRQVRRADAAAQARKGAQS